MEGSDGSPPSSLWMIHAAELFPKPPMEKEDEQLTVPFQELSGESVKYLGRIDNGVLALSNYRLFLLKNSTYSETSVPLGLIESAQIRDLFHLLIYCKDASTVKCSFETAEQCTEWQRRITLSVGVPGTLESLFAFPFYSWTSDSQHQHHNQQQQQQQGNNVCNSSGGGGQSEVNNTTNEWSGRLQRAGRFEDDFRKEVERLQFDLNGVWRISSANEEFKLCPSYPPLILVPCCISDDTLQNVANFRGSRRLPAVVWRHKQSGAVIARSSQPEVGWLGWRNSKDEQLLKALADACAFDRGEQSRRQNLCTSGESTPSSAEGSHEEVCMDEIRKILIVDARSYTSAVTNRARGGGCECIEYYPCAEIEFMNLGNIHAIRKSFHALRQLCASPPDVPNWLGLLERTMWLQHLSGLLAASMTVCHAIEKKGRPVLVHCSDGWDRTPQIVATAELCLDPYYRTVEGFRILAEREWLNFGHKFADRCGHGPGSDEINERCPVFLQWLDIVHQIHRQFPCSFEFSMAYLIKLAQHSHSCLFGTFLCNSLKERIDNTVLDRTFSVWPFLSGSIYKNPLYVPNKEKILWPAHNVRDLVLWSEVYLGSLGNQNSSDCPLNTSDNNQQQGTTSPMTKTRSYGDLMTVGSVQNGITRRSSDPNMTVESHLIMPNNHSDNNSIMDASSDRDDVETPDIIANIIHDTTEKLQNLTNELNQSEEDIYKISNFDEDDDDDDNNANNTIRSSQQDCLQQYNKALLKKLQFDELENDIKTTATCSNIDNSSLITETNEIVIENGNNATVINYDNINNDDEIDGSKSQQTCYTNLEKNHEMLESVDLKDLNGMQSSSILNLSNQSQNLWYGSINTSTDTLVPIEPLQQQLQENQKTLCDIDSVNSGDQEVPSTICTASNANVVSNHKSVIINSDNHNGCMIEENTNTLNTQKRNVSNILPEVHCKTILSNTQHNITKLNNNTNNATSNATVNSTLTPLVTTMTTMASTRGMDESILILPEHQKLEISSSGKCETIPVISNNSIVNTVALPSSLSHRRRRTSSSNSRNEHYSRNISGSNTNSRFSTPGIRSLPLTPPGSTTLDRVPVTIACPDGLAHALSEQNIRLQQIVYEHKLREDALLRELHGMRMALLKKTCPHCNNQPLINDEQTDVMINEDENKVIEFCDYYTSESNERQSGFRGDSPISFGSSSRPESLNSIIDNMENLSVCSWEAVEDRSGPSSGASSTQPPSGGVGGGGNNSSSVLWVPDHAVTRCTDCQTEFWLGRRKHHCRSCGQIFCADCSEYWAPLPDERLYVPVRLCGPCYQNVTVGIQQQQNRLQSTAVNNSQHVTTGTIVIAPTITVTTSSLPTSTSITVASSLPLFSSSSNNSFTTNLRSVVSSNFTTTSSTAITTITATTSTIEPCKHAVNPSIRNDRGPLKATAASN